MARDVAHPGGFVAMNMRGMMKTDPAGAT